jgi:hypothetical protein
MTFAGCASAMITGDDTVVLLAADGIALTLLFVTLVGAEGARIEQGRHLRRPQSATLRTESGRVRCCSERPRLP